MSFTNKDHEFNVKNTGGTSSNNHSIDLDSIFSSQPTLPVANLSTHSSSLNKNQSHSPLNPHLRQPSQGSISSHGSSTKHPSFPHGSDGGDGSTSQLSLGSVTLPPVIPIRSGSHGDGGLGMTKLFLHAVFERWVRVIDTKLEWVRSIDTRTDFHLDAHLSESQDRALDAALNSLGCIGRHDPSLLVDSLLTWWKKVQVKVRDRGSKSLPPSSTVATTMGRDHHLQRSKSVMDRYLSAAEYLLLRTFHSLLSHIKLARSLDPCGPKLESFAIEYLGKLPGPLLAGPVNHRAMYRVLGRVLGLLSNLRFASLSDRFIAKLEQVPDHPDPNSTSTTSDHPGSAMTTEEESDIILTIRTMTFLHLKIYPADSLEESAEFLLSCATFLRRTTNPRIRQAYCETFASLLHPILPVVVAEVNFPTWVKSTEMLYLKAAKLLTKPGSSQFAYPFATSVLGVTQRDTFLSKFVPLLESSCVKLKEKPLRKMLGGCISQLIWVYLFRYPELNDKGMMLKKLDTLFKWLLLVPRRCLEMDASVKYLVQVTHYVLAFDLDYGVAGWLTGLLSFDSGLLGGSSGNSNGTGLSGGLDTINPDKFTIGIQAFLELVAGTAKSGRVPTFPESVVPQDHNEEGKEQDDEDGLHSIHPDDLDMKFHPPLRILLDSLDALLPALELSYGSMLVNEERCRPNPSTLATNDPALLYLNPQPPASTTPSDLIQTYPTLEIFNITYSRDKQPYFDLIATWLDGIPILVPSGFPTPRVVDFSIRLLLHIDPKVSCAAARALRRISDKGSLHVPILRSLAKLVQKIKVQFVEVLAPIRAVGKKKVKEEGNGLNLLRVFLSILTSWRDHLLSLPSDAVDREDPDAALTWSLIEETESLGLLFLCSAYVPVRSRALDILDMIASTERVYESLLIRSGDPPARIPIIDTIKSQESNAIVSNHGGSSSAYVTATSEEEQGVWQQSFPDLSKLILDKSPITTVLCRHMASSRLRQLHPHILSLSEIEEEASSNNLNLKMDPTNDNLLNTPDTVVLEQWGRYLTFVCATITYVADAQPTYAKRRDQRSTETSIQSAKDLFRLVFVLLSCTNRRIRSTVVSALCQINRNLYGYFLEDLQPFVRIVKEDTKSRCTTPRDFHTMRRQDGFREGIAECLARTVSAMLSNDDADDSIALQTLPFIQDVFLYLSQPEVQNDWAWQELRIYFCQLVMGVFNKLSLTNPKSIPFDLRHGLFLVAERWCGHGTHRNSTRDREMVMMTQALESCPTSDVIARGARTLEMEGLRKKLEVTSLKLMASLCQGPIISSSSSFDLPSLFRWIDSLLNSPDPQTRPIAQDALNALLSHNLDNPLLYENVLHRCYALDTTPGYFLALSDILMSAKSPPITPGKRILLMAYKCGDPDPEVRRAACRLVRKHWVTLGIQSSLEEDRLCGRIMHPLATVYEPARVDVSVGLCRHHSELVLEVVSEVVMRLPSVGGGGTSNLTCIFQLLTPWVHAIKLTLEDGEGLSIVSTAIVTNLLCLVVKYSDRYPADLERLWQALMSSATRPETEGVIQFLIKVNLERRNPQLVFHTKNVFIYICRTLAGPNMLEYLTSSLTPTSMIPQKPSRSTNSQQPSSKSRAKHLSSPLFVANLDDYILTHTKRPAFSPGQLILIFISDIILAYSSITHLPLLLHLGACQAYDAGLLPTVMKDLTQPILPNLLVGIVSSSNNHLPHEGQLVEGIRGLISKYLTSVLESTTSLALEELVQGTMTLMSSHAVPILEQWNEVASQWATTCPIRSVSRASFTIYRNFPLPLYPKGVTEMLGRLSSTLSDDKKDIQTFAQEILVSLKTRLDSSFPATEDPSNLDEWTLPMIPTLFWFLVGCLNTYHEQEYTLCLTLLSHLTSNMTYPTLLKISQFLAYLPDHLYIPSIEDGLILGISSTTGRSVAMELLRRFLDPPQSSLIVDAKKIGLALLLMDIPNLLGVAMLGENDGEKEMDSFQLTLPQLSDLALVNDCPALSKLILNLSNQKFRTEAIGMQKLLNGLREGFLPQYEREAMQITLGLLFDKNAGVGLSSEWIRRRILMCKSMMSMVDLTKLDLLESNQHHQGGVGEVGSLLKLLDFGEVREEGLDLVEELLSSSSFSASKDPRGDGLGLYVHSTIADLHPLHEPDQESLSSTCGLTWGVTPSSSRQESTRSLLSAVAQASTLALDSLMTDPQGIVKEPKNSLGIDPNPNISLLTTSGSLFPPAPFNLDPMAPPVGGGLMRSISPFHPPIMTDFYTTTTDLGSSSPRPYFHHHYASSSTNSVPQLTPTPTSLPPHNPLPHHHQYQMGTAHPLHTITQHHRSHSNHHQKQHQRNPSSLTSLVDFYTRADLSELNYLYTSITELEGFFGALQVEGVTGLKDKPVEVKE